MIRRLSLLLASVFLVSLCAHAQGIADKIEVFGGYSYERFRGSSSSNMNGWEVSGQYKITDWLGGVADFDGHSGTSGGLNESVHTYLFGPQVSFPARISPFAHVLFGGAHFSHAGFPNSSFATAIGFGLDARIVHGISWRVIQGDYIHTHFFGSAQNNARLSTGIVVHF